MVKKTIASVGTVATALAAGVALASPASAAADTCSSGTHYEGHSIGSLSNGTLYGGMVHAKRQWNRHPQGQRGYTKTSGSGVQVVFGWERINCTATVNGGSYWSGVYSMSPGQTKEVAFTYSGGVVANSTYPCVRAKMKDNISGVTYWGRTPRLYG